MDDGEVLEFGLVSGRYIYKSTEQKTERVTE